VSDVPKTVPHRVTVVRTIAAYPEVARSGSTGWRRSSERPLPQVE
jgi:hypothetical protein